MKGGGRLFEVGANSRLASYSHKYGICLTTNFLEMYICYFPVIQLVSFL